MEPQKKLFVLFAFAVFIFSTWSCSNDDDATPDDEQGQMSAIVSGEHWKAETVSAGAIQGRFSISGIASDGSTISLALNGFGVGEYNSYSGASNAFVWQPSSGALGYASNAPMGIGQVFVEEVNEQDSLISGTFYFLAQEPSSGDTVSVFDGEFTDVRYHLQTMTVGDNFLKTKIDGNLWEAVMVTGYVNGNKLHINGTNSDVSRTVSLIIPATTTTGNYAIGNPFSATYGGIYLTGNTSLTANSGALTITSHDLINKVIQGTFSFEATEFFGSASASLTEGSFYVAY